MYGTVVESQPVTNTAHGRWYSSSLKLIPRSTQHDDQKKNVVTASVTARQSTSHDDCQTSKRSEWCSTSDRNNNSDVEDVEVLVSLSDGRLVTKAVGGDAKAVNGCSSGSVEHELTSVLPCGRISQEKNSFRSQLVVNGGPREAAIKLNGH
jgi:hypothetical protein